MSPAERRTPKSIRLGAEDLARSQALLAALSQYGSESELLAEATRRGLMLLEVEAWTSGLDVEGVRPIPLAMRLSTALLPAFEFLVRWSALPALLRIAPATDTPPPPPAAPAAIVPSAAHDLAGLGSGFLDDDDEEA
jgi:hypothetical protein